MRVLQASASEFTLPLGDIVDFHRSRRGKKQILCLFWDPYFIVGVCNWFWQLRCKCLFIISIIVFVGLELRVKFGVFWRMEGSYP